MVTGGSFCFVRLFVFVRFWGMFCEALGVDWKLGLVCPRALRKEF